MNITNTMRNRTKYDVETGLTHAYVDCGNTVKDMLLSDNEVKIWKNQKVDSPDKIAAAEKRLESLSRTADHNRIMNHSMILNAAGKQDAALFLKRDSKTGDYYNSLSEFGAKKFRNNDSMDDWFLNDIGNVQVDSTINADAPSFRQMAVLANSNMLWRKIGERNSEYWERMFFLAPLTALKDYMTQISWIMFGKLSDNNITRVFQIFRRSLRMLIFLPAFWFMFCLWVITFPIRMICKFARPYHNREQHYLSDRYQSVAMTGFLIVTAIIGVLYFTPVFRPMVNTLKALDPFKDYVDANIVNPYMNLLQSVGYSDIFRFFEIPFSSEGIRLVKISLSLPFAFICYPITLNSLIFFGWIAILGYDTIKNLLLPVFGNSNEARHNRRELRALSSNERLIVRRALFVVNPDAIDRGTGFCLIALIYSFICAIPGINILFAEKIYRTAYKI